MNWREFLREWYSLIRWTGGIPGKQRTHGEYLAQLLLLLGLPTAAIFEPVRPYAVYLFIPLFAYLCWTGGMAFQRARGAVVKVSTLKRVLAYDVFEVKVQNVGSGEITARVFVIPLAGFPNMASEIEAHWRGTDNDMPMRLAGRKVAHAGVLYSRVNSASTPELCEIGIAALRKDAKPNQYSQFPLVEMPFEKLPTLELFLRIVFENKDGEFVRDKVRGFRVSPIIEMPFEFRIEPIRESSKPHISSATVA